MVSREDCITTINSFIKTKNINTSMTLFEYLCDVMEVPNKQIAIDFVTSNSFVLIALQSGIFEGLSRHFNICKVLDKNNNLLTVY